MAAIWLPSASAASPKGGGRLLEVAVEETLETGAVAGFVLGHLMNGVVDRVIAELLRALRDRELGGAGALFGVGAHGDVLLGRVGEDLAEKLRELGGVLGLLESVALERLGDLGIALALGLAGHREIHADLGALAGEVILEALSNLGVIDLAGAYGVLARPDLLARLDSLLLELGAGNSALRALLRRSVTFIYIPANGADPSLHFKFPFFGCCKVVYSIFLENASGPPLPPRRANYGIM